MQITKQQEEELEALIRRAGARLMAYWPGASAKRDLGIQKKGDGTLVTRADIESNDLLIEGLNRLFPEDDIFSEERPREELARGAVRTWIIDPLDGTKSFTEGNDDFSILLGRCVGKHIDYGLMYFPARELFARGAVGQGAIVNGEPMHVSSSSSLRDRCVYFRHVDLAQERCCYPEWLDSGMAFLNLCRGELDGIIIKLIHHQEWDLAASTLLIRESGGVVTDEQGAPFVFNCAPVTSKYLVASNGIVHEQLLKLIPETTVS